jgi:hypothetical protein
MWMMLPLYSIYIPFTFIEIYFLMTNKRDLAKKLALPLVVIGLGIDIAEFYIQGILFQLNTPRHMWVDFPALWIYFLISGALSGIAFGAIYATLALKEKSWYDELQTTLRKAGIVVAAIVAVYTMISGMNVGEAPFTTMYWGSLIVGAILPIVLWFVKMDFLAALSAAIGTFGMRELFVYAGNAEPMSNRFGLGVESTSTYIADIEKVIYDAPHTMEVLVIIGCLGLGIAIFKLLDTLLDVSNQPH